MAISSIVDTSIHIQSFRNVALFEQGVYMVRLTLTEQDGTCDPPYLLDKCMFPNRVPPKHQISPGRTQDFSYFSQSFYITYSEEEAQINEIVVFRSEVEDYDCSLTIVADLMFADPLCLDAEEALKNPPMFSDFSILNTQKVTIRDPTQGVAQFIPVHFNKYYPCQVSLCVYTAQVDFKFRFAPGANKEGNKDTAELLAQLIFHSQEVLEPTEIDFSHTLYVKHLLRNYKNLCELLEKLTEELPDEAPPVNEFDCSCFAQRLSGRALTRSPSDIASLLLQDIQDLSIQINRMQHSLLELLKSYPVETAFYLQKQYLFKLKDHWGSCTFRDAHYVSNFAEPSKTSTGPEHLKMAKTLRKTPLFANIDQFEVYQQLFFPHYTHHPVLFQDIFYTKQSKGEVPWTSEFFSYIQNPSFKRKGVHLIVLVHGFQGSSMDVRAIRNCITSLRSDCLTLCSSANEGEVDASIAHMGARLATEVLNYIRDWCPAHLLAKISFIGHSLGGLVIRAALPLLVEHSDIFHMLLTIATPHLGCMMSSSALVSAGMWVLKKWGKNKCIRQLAMSDKSSLKATFLYELSKFGGLEWFRHIVFVSSYQDMYCPYESSRVEISRKIIKDRVKGPVFLEMAQNLMNRVKTGEIYRLDVSYKAKSKGIDTFIGRSAHIDLLDNPSLIQMILFSSAHFFE